MQKNKFVATWTAYRLRLAGRFLQMTREQNESRLVRDLLGQQSVTNRTGMFDDIGHDFPFIITEPSVAGPLTDNRMDYNWRTVHSIHQ